MRVLDLFAGLGGFSAAFEKRGHEVVTLDNDPQFKTDIIMDIREYHPDGHFDVVLASPPCQEFSKSSLPPSWPSVQRYGCHPSTDLLDEAVRVIREADPTYWVIENVRGAVKFFEPLLGRPHKVVGSRYLWGIFPIFDTPKKYGKWKLPPSKDRPALRSLIPYGVSLSLCKAMELEMMSG